ncbi:MAG: DUF1343 domain-containing protein [Kiritimatiellae bacterium]|jgi:beta-N-acetylhexosaminidase|nr:DUF1343 domain-containing protein [Kiritimatiellia bacterium]
MSGLHRLLQLDSLPMAGAKVGFLGHHASVTPDGTHAVDALRQRSEWSLTRLFSPEHGFFGKAAAGEQVDDSLHPHWQLPVHSLYGETRSPKPEWLEDLDVMVIDLQDLGVRCYTYGSTLQNVLHACAKASLPVMVLDREIPLAGVVDGPMLDPDLKSFVGQLPLPLVYGQSQGELARTLKSLEPELASLDLTVLDGLPSYPPSTWITPSPAIVSRESACLYPLTVWSEAIANVWVDRGGPLSFQCWAMPDLTGKVVETMASSMQLPGIRVTPKRFETPNGTWHGFHFQRNSAAPLLPVTAAIHLLSTLRDHLGSDRLFAPPASRPDFFDQLMGSRSVRDQLCTGKVR